MAQATWVQAALLPSDCQYPCTGAGRESDGWGEGEKLAEGWGVVILIFCNSMVG